MFQAGVPFSTCPAEDEGPSYGLSPPSSPATDPHPRSLYPFLAEDSKRVLSSSSSHVRLAGWWTNVRERGGDRLTRATSKMDTSAMRTKARANVALPRGTNRTRRLAKKNESRAFGTIPSRRETAGYSRGKERSTWSTGLQATSDCNGVSEGSYQTAVDVVRASARTRWKIRCEWRSCRNLAVKKRGALYSLVRPCWSADWRWIPTLFTGTIHGRERNNETHVLQSG